MLGGCYLTSIMICFRLEDFENSCSAYDKAIELNPDDYVTFLNYSITLYLNDEIEKAKEQFSRFEVLFNLQGDSASNGTAGEVDPDIVKQSTMMKTVLTGIN